MSLDSLSGRPPDVSLGGDGYLGDGHVDDGAEDRPGLEAASDEHPHLVRDAQVGDELHQKCRRRTSRPGSGWVPDDSADHGARQLLQSAVVCRVLTPAFIYAFLESPHISG